MGLVQSDQTRTVTFENDHDPGLKIFVSEDVRKRIFENLEKGNSAQSNEKPVLTRPPSPVPSDNPAQGHRTSTVPCGEQFWNHRKSQESDDRNDDYWRKSLQDMENVLHKSNTVMENEFQTTYAQVQETFAKAPPSHRVPPCENFKEELLHCYGSNVGHTLNCFAEVSAFTSCVNRNRVKRLDKTSDIFEHGNDIKF